MVSAVNNAFHIKCCKCTVDYTYQLVYKLKLYNLPTCLYVCVFYGYLRLEFVMEM
jgi:hypothetical protein